MTVSIENGRWEISGVQAEEGHRLVLGIRADGYGEEIVNATVGRHSQTDVVLRGECSLRCVGIETEDVDSVRVSLEREAGVMIVVQRKVVEGSNGTVFFSALRVGTYRVEALKQPQGVVWDAEVSFERGGETREVRYQGQVDLPQSSPPYPIGLKL